jgi:hypothetical protein
MAHSDVGRSSAFREERLWDEGHSWSGRAAALSAMRYGREHHIAIAIMIKLTRGPPPRWSAARQRRPHTARLGMP